MQKNRKKLVFEEKGIYELTLDTYLDDKKLLELGEGLIEQHRLKRSINPIQVFGRKLIRVEDAPEQDEYEV